MPGSNRWRFVVTNLKGERVAEVKDAYERKYTANLSKPSIASFQVRKDNSIVPYLFSEEEDFLLQVWQGGTPRLWGPILTANLAMSDAGPASIAVAAADPSWRLGKRYYWGAAAGYTVGVATDKAVMAQNLIGYQNARAEVGITANTGIAGNNDTCGSTGTYTALTGESCLAGIQKLAQGFDGFDWYIQPLPEAVQLGTAPWSPYIGIFRAAAAVGSAKPSAVFEYGSGRRNMRSVNYLKDQTTRANSVFNISEEGPVPTVINTAPYINRIDTANWQRYGLYETMAELSGVPTVALREGYVTEALAVRKRPRRVLAMTSDIDDGTGRVPVFGVDYWLGDSVRSRAYLDGVKLFDGSVRVYAVEVSLDNAGVATYTPILVQEGE